MYMCVCMWKYILVKSWQQFSFFSAVAVIPLVLQQKTEIKIWTDISNVYIIRVT